MLLRIPLLAGVTAIFTGCAPHSSTPITWSGLEGPSRCVRPAWLTQAAVATPTEIDPNAVTRLKQIGLSPDASWIAVGLGLAPLLQERFALSHSELPLKEAQRIRRLEMDQSIDRRISIVGLDVSSLTSTLECYEERWEGLANILEREHSSRETWLMVSAIAVGAVAGIGAGVLELKHQGTPATIVGISGSTVGALLGAATFLPERRVYASPNDSLLSDLWSGRPTSAHAPRPIWLFLTATPPGGTALRTRFLQRLEDLGILGAPGPERQRREALFFEGGRAMSATELHLYASMMDELESQVSSIHTMLMQLLRELDAWRAPEE